MEKKILDENIPWCAYGKGKQEWKANGNYYTAEELREMDKDDSVQLKRSTERIMFVD